MKFRFHHLLALIQSFLVINIPFMDRFFTLGDRDRYIAINEIDYSENFSRTELIDLIFNFGGKNLEVILGIISSFLHFYLVSSFCKTLKIGKVNQLISFIFLFLPAHFILRSIAGKELICSILFCLIIIISYPVIFLKNEDSELMPGNFLRKKKILIYIIFPIIVFLLLYIRPFFFIIYLLFLIPYLYEKIKLKQKLKKLFFINIFLVFVSLFITTGNTYYSKVQDYISLNFVGQGDSFFTNYDIPFFYSFYDYFLFLINNSYKAILGPDLTGLLSNNSSIILLVEGLFVLIPFLILIITSILKFLIMKKISLKESFTNFVTLLFFLIVYSLLGYVNFLAGWRLQSGSWILLILLYLKMCDEVFKFKSKY